MADTPATSTQPLIDWVSQLVRDLCEKPDELSFKATVDERGLLITIYAVKDQLGRLIGKGGTNAEALRSIVSLYGINHAARISVKITDAVK